MKIIGATLSLILIAASPAFSQWRQNDKHLEDTPERKEVRGFGGHLVVVSDPQGFIKEWLKPETPRIHQAFFARRGEALGAFVLFAGCQPDVHGICNAEVDYTIYNPDGSLLAERKGQPLWKDEAPPAPIIQLSRAILSFTLEKKDPPGQYKVKAKVRDLNADISFELETKFWLGK